MKRPLPEKSGYALWTIRIEANFNARGISAAFKNSNEPDETYKAKLSEKQKQESGILNNACHW